MLTFTLPPLADLGDVLQGLVPIIFVVLYGVAHLVGTLQQEKKKLAPPRPRPAPPPPQAAGPRPAPLAPQGGAKAPTLEDSLRREVEEFLRRAQGQAPAQPGQPPRREQRPQPAQRVQPPEQRPAPQRTPLRPADRTTPERPQPFRRVVEAPRSLPTASLPSSSEPHPPVPLGAGVSQHVASHLGGTKELVQHAQQLGADVAQADERMQEHLRHRFAHQLGALSPTASAAQTAAAPATLAQELRNMLARPAGMRQLVVASEILRRPEERWER
jgi:hypothetical protein